MKKVPASIVALQEKIAKLQMVALAMYDEEFTDEEMEPILDRIRKYAEEVRRIEKAIAELYKNKE